MSLGGDCLLGGDFFLGGAAFLAFRAARLAFEAAVNDRTNSSFCLRLCSAAFLASRAGRLAFEAAVNKFANCLRDMTVFGLFGRGIVLTIHTYFLRDPRKSTLASTRLI